MTEAEEQARNPPAALPEPSTLPLLAPKRSPLSRKGRRRAGTPSVAEAQWRSKLHCPQRAVWKPRLHDANEQALRALVAAKCPALPSSKASEPAANAPAMRAPICTARAVTAAREQRRTVLTLAMLRSRLRDALPPRSPSPPTSRQSSRSRRLQSPAGRDQPQSPAMLNLTHCGLCDTDMAVLCSLLLGAPAALRGVDLRGNPQLTDLAVPGIGEALTANFTVEEVLLDGTGLSAAGRAFVEGLAQANRGRRERRDQRKQQQSVERREAEWRRACLDEWDQLLDEEWEQRRAIGEDNRRLRREIVSEFATVKAAEELRQARLRELARRRQQRQHARLSEQQGRHGVAVAEWGHRVDLAAAMWERGGRIAVLGEQLEVRVTKKKEEAADWILIRRLEKARFKREAEARASHEEQELVSRGEEEEEEEAARRLLVQVASESHADASQREQDRLEKERAEEWARIQEQLRQEKEIEMRLLREAREAARKEAQLRQQRERFCTSERAARVILMRDEDWRRSSIAELHRIARAVASARGRLGDAERARAAAYRAAPTLTLAHTALSDWHFLGQFRKAKKVASDFQLAHVAQPHGCSSWEALERACRTTKEQTVAAVQHAQAELEQHARDVAPALFPQLDDDGPIRRRDKANKSHSSLSRRASAAAAGSRKGGGKTLREPEPWDPALKELLSGGRESRPTVWYDDEDLEFHDPPPVDGTLEKKLHVLSGVVTVTAAARTRDDMTLAMENRALTPDSPAATSQRRRDDMLTLEDPPETCKLRPQAATWVMEIDVPEGTATDTIADLLGSVRYQNLSTDSMLHVERTVHVHVSLRYPSLDPAAVDKYGCIKSRDAFAASTESFTETLCAVVVVPPLVSAPPDSLTITYEEDTPTEKCVLMPEVTVTPVPLLSVMPSGVMIPRPGGLVLGSDGDSSYEGGFLRVRFVQNFTPDDQIILVKRFDDDVGVQGNWKESERQLCFGVRGFGDAFAVVTAGELLTHKECQERGDLMGVPHSARSSDGIGGFELSFTHAELCRSGLVQKVLRRLRFANLSQNPVTATRKVEVVLGDRTGQESRVEVTIEIIEEDDPTEMTLPFKRLHYRMQGTSAVPIESRPSLRVSALSLFPKAILRDPDTEHFRGGDVCVYATAVSKGDAYFLRCNGTKFSVDKKGDLSWEGSVVGSLEEGLGRAPDLDLTAGDDRVSRTRSRGGGEGLVSDSVSAAPSKVASDSKAGGSDVVFKVTFTVDGKASISMVQRMLRCICYTNTQYSPPEGWRSVELVVRFGPNADLSEVADVCPLQFQTLQDKVDLRISPALFEVPKAHHKVQYKEGSGAQRIAPFEVVPDQQAVVENGYGGGYVLAEIIEGYSEDDVLNLRGATGSGGGKDDLVVTLRPGAHPHIPDFDGCTDEDYMHEGKWDRVRGAATTLTAFRRLSSRAQSGSPAAGGKGVLGAIIAKLGAKQQSPKAEADPRRAAGSRRGTRDSRPAAGSRHSTPRASGGLTPPRWDGGGGAGNTSGNRSPRSTHDVMESVRDKLQLTVDERMQRLTGLADRISKATEAAQSLQKQGVDERTAPHQGSVSDVMCDKTRHVGTVSIKSRSLLVSFDQKTAVSRRDVVSILRSLTYANRSSDPESLKKVIRISLKDSGQVATQAIIQVEILSVDDVTEVHLTESRLRYSYNSVRVFQFGCLPIAPVRRACLVDPDTEYLDGGYLYAEISGGGQRGDTLGFMTPEQQMLVREEGAAFAQRMAEARQAAAADGTAPPTPTAEQEIWDVPVHPGCVEVQDGKRLVETAGGVEIGTLEVAKQGPVTNLRVKFAAHKPQRITLTLAGAVLNCFCYNNTAEKMTPGQRTCVFRINDGSNPSEGKTKLAIDVVRPLVLIPPAHLTKVCPQGINYELNPLERPQVSLGEGKAAAGELLRKGFTQIALSGGAAEGDQVGIAAGTNLAVKDGGLYLGVDFLGKVSMAPQRMRLEHSWSSKLGQKALTSLVSAVQVKTGRVPPARKVFVDLTCSDGRNDPCFVRVVLDVKK